VGIPVPIGLEIGSRAIGMLGLVNVLMGSYRGLLCSLAASFSPVGRGLGFLGRGPLWNHRQPPIRTTRMLRVWPDAVCARWLHTPIEERLSFWIGHLDDPTPLSKLFHPLGPSFA